MQISAINDPHVDVQLSVDFPTVVDGHHVRLAQPSSSPRFSEQPLSKVLVVRVAWLQQLKRYHTVHHGVFGLPHITEAAPTQQPPKPVVPELRTGTEWPAIKDSRILVHYSHPRSDAGPRCNNQSIIIMLPALEPSTHLVAIGCPTIDQPKPHHCHSRAQLPVGAR